MTWNLRTSFSADQDPSDSIGATRGRWVEIAWLAGLLLVGAALRAYGLASLGLVHFDEGAYCTSALWFVQPAAERQLYPDQQLFAPPLYVTLVGVAYLVLGAPHEVGAIVVNIAFGTATIALAFWLARRIAGSGAGLAAATMVAMSQYHIAYSRVALTDVVFCFFLLLAVNLMAVSIERASLKWALLAGLVTGLAWNTKYHGWLALIVTGAAYPLYWLGGGRSKLRVRRHLACWLTASAVAAACYLPWACYIQWEAGGYLKLMKYQSGFLSRNWLQNFFRQCTAQWYFDGGLTRFSPAIAATVCLLFNRRSVRMQWGHLVIVLVALAMGLLFGGTGTTALAAVAAMIVCLRSGTPSFRESALIGMFCVFLVLTPMYRPYPRLLMPLILCCCVLAGVSVDAIVRGWSQTIDRADATRRSWQFATVATIGLTAAIVGGAARLGPGSLPRTWMPTGGLRDVARRAAQVIPSGATVVVFGEAPMVFYLRMAGHNAVPDRGDPGAIERATNTGAPTYVLTGIYANRKGDSHQVRRMRRRLQKMARYPFRPNDIRLLDDFKPIKAIAFLREPTDEYELTLYRVIPADLPASSASN